ncbi:Cytosolic non-specific dipeptidase, partial [Blattella germanica]
CIEHNKENYINELREAVRIKSVSIDPDLRVEVNRMVFWFEDVLKKTGFKTEICETGFQDEKSGLKYPPILLASFKGSAKKRTILFYGHLDVYPAEKSEGWHTDPFDLIERGDKLYGRGSSDNKGPVLAWINALNAYRDSEVELPVHIKVILEGMEESFSEGFEELCNKKKAFFKDIDYVCISDGSWIGTSRPCISYGFRGLCHFRIDVECAKKHLDSGTYGGVLNEALADLIYMLGSLTDKDGKILVPGIYTDVAKLTTTEDDAMKKIDIDLIRYKEGSGIKKLLFKEDKVKILHHLWRFPSLSYHKIDHINGSKSPLDCVPGKVSGRFSLRIVPNQTTKRVEKLVTDYLKKKWKEYGSGNDFMVCILALKIFNYSFFPKCLLSVSYK